MREGDWFTTSKRRRGLSGLNKVEAREGIKKWGGKFKRVQKNAVAQKKDWGCNPGFTWEGIPEVRANGR